MSNRLERANSEIQKCLTEIIKFKMNDPRLDKILSLTEVNVTPDFKYCKVKVSVLDLDDVANVTRVLQNSEGYIKRELAKMINMPQVPKINFVVDRSVFNAMRVEEILRTLDIPPAEEVEDGEDA
ncbi:MAG: 30S ribosome-binding factor RbfA [Clostridia bacterium]|nr:30S ribosome-binding factor RbfA [Clostridia bacterium]